jgi:5-methylcytosine-specific restriction endonuclease McrA
VRLKDRATLEREVQERQQIRDQKLVAQKEARNKAFRERYWSRPDHERQRTSDYKARNWERKLQWDEIRRQRITTTADGTVTDAVIGKLKQEAEHCVYCGAAFKDRRDKQTEHVVPLCNGGTHTLENIVIACASCNGSKGTSLPGEWVNNSGVLPQPSLRSGKNIADIR